MLTRRQLTVAVASGGGHWEQLLLATANFSPKEICYITTKRELLENAAISNGHVVPDCNRNERMKTAKCIYMCARLILKLRPRVIISTGAAPGLICLIFGRIVGSKTIWIDSIANVETLSLSGKMARFVTTEWLTQWEHLASKNGPHYVGQLL